MGTQYRTGIYYSNEQQRVAAERSRDDLQRKLGSTAVATEVAGWIAIPYLLILSLLLSGGAGSNLVPGRRVPPKVPRQGRTVRSHRRPLSHPVLRIRWRRRCCCLCSNKVARITVEVGCMEIILVDFLIGTTIIV